MTFLIFASFYIFTIFVCSVSVQPAALSLPPLRVYRFLSSLLFWQIKLFLLNQKILHFNFFPVRFFVGKVFVRSASGSSLLKYLNIFFLIFLLLYFSFLQALPQRCCLCFTWKLSLRLVLYFIFLFLWLIPHHIEDRHPDSRTESTGGKTYESRSVVVDPPMRQRIGVLN